MTPIHNYFSGEKAESILFITSGIVALVMPFYFIFVLKTSFWKGVAIPFLLVASLEIVVGFTIFIRSPKDKIRVESYMSHEPQKIKQEEIPRMEKVLHNFLIYRYVEIALIFIGIIFMYYTKNDTFLKGIGFGLFIMASIVLTLDFFAERRGIVYLEYLQNFTTNL